MKVFVAITDAFCVLIWLALFLIGNLADLIAWLSPRGKLVDEMMSRPPIERMMHISRKLVAGEIFTTNMLAGELEVSPRTIFRDIEFLRDRLGYEIEWNQNCPMEEWTFVGRPPKERVL